MTADLQTLKGTAQATAETSPELLVTVPAGVMVELIRDAERYRWLKVDRRPAADLDAAFNTYGIPVDEAIDSAMAKEAQ